MGWTPLITDTLVPRRAATSIDELVGAATSREPLEHGDSKSGSTLNRVIIDGEPFVVKTMHSDVDWIARTLGDLCCWPVWLDRAADGLARL
jgi:hypothetical protein